VLWSVSASVLVISFLLWWSADLLGSMNLTREKRNQGKKIVSFLELGSIYSLLCVSMKPLRMAVTKGVTRGLGCRGSTRRTQFSRAWKRYARYSYIDKTSFLPGLLWSILKIIDNSLQWDIIWEVRIIYSYFWGMRPRELLAVPFRGFSRVYYLMFWCITAVWGCWVVITDVSIL
jgi:hypothetical protein